MEVLSYAILHLILYVVLPFVVTYVVVLGVGTLYLSLAETVDAAPADLPRATVVSK